MKVWNKLASYRGTGKFSTWVFGIAYNEWRMAARRKNELSLADVADVPPEPTVTSDAAASHLRMDLAEALKTLTAAERAAIILCCQNGLSHDEAAQALDCPLGTVKTNILRGKEKLRSKLAL